MVESKPSNSDRSNNAIIVMCSAIVFCFVIVPLFFLFQMEGNLRKIILIMIFAPILVYLFYLFVYTTPAFILAYISNGERRENPEIEGLEINYRRVSKEYLIKQLGLIQYFRMTGGINRGLNSGFEYCKNLLNHEQVKNDSELNYHVLIRLYKSSCIDEKYVQGADYLEKALELKPNDVLTVFWMAEANEIQGKKDDAIDAYKRLTQDFSDISLSLKYYLLKQIQRIELKGPKVPHPMSGLKYMSW